MKNSESQTPKKQKSPFREWIDSVVFAVVAATLIRFFLFEAYTIPTPSMESSLMVGDFLFIIVSKDTHSFIEMQSTNFYRTIPDKVL